MSVGGRKAGPIRGLIAALAAAALAVQPALADGSGDDHREHVPPAGVTAPYLVDLFPSTYRPLPRVDTLIAHAIVLVVGWMLANAANKS